MRVTLSSPATPLGLGGVIETEVTVTVPKRLKYNIVYWRASVASETLTGVKMKKSGMFVYLYIYLDVRMSFCTLTLAFLC